MKNILIKNGRIWDGNQFFLGDVLIDNGIIDQISDEIKEDAGFIFDATGMIVSPGLIDLHIHMKGTEPDKYGIHAEMSTIPFGVTAAADAGGAHADGPLTATYLLKNVTFVKVPIKSNVPNFAPTEEKLKLYGSSAIGLKVYFDTASTEVQDIRPLKVICDYAEERGLKVMVHCSGSPVPMAQILETLRPGDILTHAFHGGSHTAADDDFVAMRAAQSRGVIIDTGFAGYIHTNFPIFRKAIAKGIIPDTISTDITRASAYKRGGRYGMTMCMGIAREAGMTEDQIFRCVTSAPAKALNKEDVWGHLSVGRCADISVLEYTKEPFCMSNTADNCIQSDYSYRCKLTIVDGNVVWRD